jgi:hypothetical protein
MRWKSPKPRVPSANIVTPNRLGISRILSFLLSLLPARLEFGGGKRGELDTLVGSAFLVFGMRLNG